MGTSETSYFRRAGLDRAFLASEEITLGQMVKMSTTDETVSICGDAEDAIGIAIAGQYTKVTGATEGKVGTGDYVTVRTQGEVYATTASICTAADYVDAAASGEIDPMAATTTVAHMKAIVGYVVKGAAASGTALIRLCGVRM